MSEVKKELTEKEIFDKCLQKWGLQSQLLMLAEESSELTQATLHLFRNKKSQQHLHLAEEIVDVELMLAEIKYYIPELEIQMVPIRRQKLERLIHILEEEGEAMSEVKTGDER